MPGSRLICDEKDRSLSNVAVADDNPHDDSSIKAAAKHSTGRIRNARRRENESQVDRRTWKTTWRQVIRPRKKVDPGLLHIKGWT